jgi:hypothetical protein
MTSLYTRGSVTTLHGFGGCVETAFGHFSCGLSQFHGHGSWLIFEVTLNVTYAICEGPKYVDRYLEVSKCYITSEHSNLIKHPISHKHNNSPVESTNDLSLSPSYLFRGAVCKTALSY